ncbi:hypothetical protein QA634_03800 [Methylobacterium sp. CB376]|uniref:hypothetical protein n=1 Tax=unclassified Methylobacterium TaxID=2615210 RepID=UPI0005BBBA10|nr:MULTISPECIES: hypothetical protein [Methylobacterium]WFT81037.1 hypothetical protein QA634_03800 [Methylobacterium nodulans]
MWFLAPPSAWARFLWLVAVDAYASTLNYTAFLRNRARRVFRCAGADAQFAAAGCPDLVRVLPQTAFQRTDWRMPHPDSRETRRCRPRLHGPPCR